MSFHTYFEIAIKAAEGIFILSANPYFKWFSPHQQNVEVNLQK